MLIYYCWNPDTRNIPALGRIGDPDDILGSVRVEEGKVSLRSLLLTPRIRIHVNTLGPPADHHLHLLSHRPQIMPETYAPMPSYRVCTGDGVTKLTDGLAERLREVLERRSREEEERE